MDISDILDKIIGAAWCREFGTPSSEGFSDWFLDDSEDYCIRRDNRIRLTWDSLGHLDVDELFDFGDGSGESEASDSSSASSSESEEPSDPSMPGCYELRILGRFLEGPCESGSSEGSSCHDVFCSEGGSFDPGLDLGGDEPKVLVLCFDELGHLVSVSKCGELLWHMNGWIADRSASDSSQDADDDLDLESNSLTEGVEIELYLPIDEDESDASRCDLPIYSQCDPLPVRRAVLCFDSLGHLFSVYGVEYVELPCGILTECEDDAIPKHFLAVFSFHNTFFDVPGIKEQCALVSWNGCRWKGTVLAPCCYEVSPFDPGPPPVAPVYELIWIPQDFEIGCVTYPDDELPPPGRPWYLCMRGESFQFTIFNPCPLDGKTGGGGLLEIEEGECHPFGFVAQVMEIPCDVECGAGVYWCADVPEPSLPGPP